MNKCLLAVLTLLISLSPGLAFAQSAAPAAPPAPAASVATPPAPAAAPAPVAAAAPAPVAAPAPEPAAPVDTADLAKRVADLEGYVNNVAPADVKTSKVPGPGPGHNGWMMVCAALVLFMTLPGLALFYGGLVREKNVLSVMAQCLGLAGIVTVMW